MVFSIILIKKKFRINIFVFIEQGRIFFENFKFFEVFVPVDKIKIQKKKTTNRKPIQFKEKKVACAVLIKPVVFSEIVVIVEKT